MSLLRATMSALGRWFEEGRLDASRAEPTIHDEPLDPESFSDFRYALDLVWRKRDAERARLERIEAKTAPVLAGTIAALGLFIDKAATLADLVSACLFLIPLFVLLDVFYTYEYQDGPDTNIMRETLYYYPKTFVKATYEAFTKHVSDNMPIIDKKARTLSMAMRFLFWITVIVLAIRLLEAAGSFGYVHPPAIFMTASTPAPSPAGNASSHKTHKTP